MFRLGELQQLSAMPELHTGTDDCPMGISVDFSGAEWRTLARKAVRKEIWGDDQGDADTVVRVLGGMGVRQQAWHGRWADELGQHCHGVGGHIGSPRQGADE